MHGMMRIQLQRRGGRTVGRRVASRTGRITRTTHTRRPSYRRSDRARVGLWPNRDPIGELGGLNLYNYLRNNPVNDFDPLGLKPALELPPGVEPPPGHRRCGKFVFADGSVKVLWCPDPDPQPVPVPPWLTTPRPKPCEAEEIRNPEDCWSSLPSDYLNLIPGQGVTKGARMAALLTGCMDCCNTHFFNKGDLWNACVANCKLQHEKAMASGASTSPIHLPGKPWIIK